MQFIKWVKAQLIPVLSIVIVVCLSVSVWAQTEEPSLLDRLRQTEKDNQRAVDIYRKLNKVALKQYQKNFERQDREKQMNTVAHIDKIISYLETDPNLTEAEKRRQRFEYYYDRELLRSGRVLKQAAGDSISFFIAGILVDQIYGAAFGNSWGDKAMSAMGGSNAQWNLNPRSINTNWEALKDPHGFVHFTAFIGASDYYNMVVKGRLGDTAARTIVGKMLTSPFSGMIVGSLVGSIVSEYGFGIKDCAVEKLGDARDHLKLHGDEITAQVAKSKSLVNTCDKLWEKFSTGRSGLKMMASLFGLVPAAMASHGLQAGIKLGAHSQKLQPLRMKSMSKLEKIVNSKYLKPIKEALKKNNKLSLRQVLTISKNTSAIKKGTIVGYQIGKAGAGVVKQSIVGRVAHRFLVRPIYSFPGFGLFLAMDAVFRPMLAEPIDNAVDITYYKKEESELLKLTQLANDNKWEFSKDSKFTLSRTEQLEEPIDSLKRRRAVKDEVKMQKEILKELSDYITLNEEYRGSRLMNLSSAHFNWTEYVKQMTQRFGTSKRFYLDLIGLGKSNKPENFTTAEGEDEAESEKHLPIGFSQKYKVVPGKINLFDAVRPMRILSNGELEPFPDAMMDDKQIGLYLLRDLSVKISGTEGFGVVAKPKKPSASSLITDIDESPEVVVPKLEFSQIRQLVAANNREEFVRTMKRLKIDNKHLSKELYEKPEVREQFTQARFANLQNELKGTFLPASPGVIDGFRVRYTKACKVYSQLKSYSFYMPLEVDPCEQLKMLSKVGLRENATAKKLLKGIEFDLKKDSIADLSRIVSIRNAGHFLDNKLENTDDYFSGAKIQNQKTLRFLKSDMQKVRNAFLSNDRKRWERGIRIIKFYVTNQAKGVDKFMNNWILHRKTRCSDADVYLDEGTDVQNLSTAEQKAFAENYVMEKDDESFLCLPDIVYSKLGSPNDLPFGAMFLQEYDKKVFKSQGIVDVHNDVVHGFKVRNLAEDFLVHMVCGTELKKKSYYDIIKEQMSLSKTPGSEFIDAEVLKNWSDMIFNPPRIIMNTKAICEQGGDPMNGVFTVEKKVPEINKDGSAVIVKKTYSNLLDLVSENMLDASYYKPFTPIMCENVDYNKNIKSDRAYFDFVYRSKDRDKYRSNELVADESSGHLACGGGEFSNITEEFWKFHVEKAYDNRISSAKYKYKNILEGFGYPEFDLDKAMTREEFTKIEAISPLAVMPGPQKVFFIKEQVEAVKSFYNYSMDYRDNFTVISSYLNQWQVFLDEIVTPIYLLEVERNYVKSVENNPEVIQWQEKLKKQRSEIAIEDDGIRIYTKDHLKQRAADKIYTKDHLKQRAADKKAKMESLDEENYKIPLVYKPVHAEDDSSKEQVIEMYFEWKHQTMESLKTLFDFRDLRSSHSVELRLQHSVALINELQLAFGVAGFNADTDVQMLLKKKKEISNTIGHQEASSLPEIETQLQSRRQYYLGKKTDARRAVEEANLPIPNVNLAMPDSGLRSAVIEKITNTMLADLAFVSEYSKYFKDILQIK